MKRVAFLLLFVAACGTDDQGLGAMGGSAAVDPDAGTAVGSGGATTGGAAPTPGGAAGAPEGAGGIAGGSAGGFGAAGGSAGVSGGVSGNTGGAAGAGSGGSGGSMPDPGRPLGDACIRDDQCASNVCLNDRCCERRCDSTCESCNPGTGKCVKAPDETPCGDGPHCKADSALQCIATNPNPACGATTQIWWEYNPDLLVTPQCQSGKCEDVETSCITLFGAGQIGFCGQRTPQDVAMCHPS